MMLNDDRICFIVVPDKKILWFVAQNITSVIMAAILNYMFYKRPTRVRAPPPPRYHHRGTSQAKSKQKSTIS